MPTLKAMGMLASFFTPLSRHRPPSCLSLLRLNEVYLPSSSLLRPRSLSLGYWIREKFPRQEMFNKEMVGFDRTILNLALIIAVMKMAVLGSNDPGQPVIPLAKSVLFPPPPLFHTPLSHSL